jgi:endonuclease/exonuclease/phosphatase family metal-dependent hydrolase
MRIAGALVLSFALAGSLRAADVPVAGKQLALGPDARGARVTLRDAAVAAPFADPRLGPATLTLHGGAADDQCFARLALDPAGWTPVGRDGARTGYRYRDASGHVRVVVRPGRIAAVVRRDAWPCATALGAQRVPVTVTLDAAATRWCAAFGGNVAHNAAGRFRAHDAPAPAACPTQRVTVATLNVLHGLTCAPATSSCRYAERMALVAQWIEARGCPDVVTFQEVLQAQVPTLTAAVAGACGGYTVTYEPVNLVDDALILSRVPVAGHSTRRLHRNFRNVLSARLDHPAGPVDVFTTHLASGSDGGGQPCGADCPATCVAAGSATIRECQAVQVADLVAARASRGPALVTGDLNAAPGGPVHDTFTQRGWPDAYETAGLPACDPSAGAGCTSGRVDDDLSELESPASNESSRIDFVFVVAPAVGTCDVEPAGDPDGDGVATRLFADEPNPFAPACGAVPLPICWPSDHVGMQADLRCR